MKDAYRLVLAAMLIGLGLGLCPKAWAQDAEHAEMDFGLRRRQLEMEQRQAEAGFQRQMQELDLVARRLEIDHLRKAAADHNGGQAGFLLLCATVNILMAVWVYMDNRRRKGGYGIWIAITLLAGFFGALVYAVIRLGDTVETRPAPTSRSTAARK